MNAHGEFQGNFTALRNRIFRLKRTYLPGFHQFIRKCKLPSNGIFDVDASLIPRFFIICRFIRTFGRQPRMFLSTGRAILSLRVRARAAVPRWFLTSPVIPKAFPFPLRGPLPQPRLFFGGVFLDGRRDVNFRHSEQAALTAFGSLRFRYSLGWAAAISSLVWCERELSLGVFLTISPKKSRGWGPVISR